MNKEDLYAIHSEIVGEALPSILDELPDNDTKFNVLLSMIQNGVVNDPEVYKRAIELANATENPNTKTDYLMRLLDAVNLQIDSGEGNDLDASDEALDDGVAA